MTTEQLARMNSAIEKLNLPEGMEMEISVGVIRDLKRYLQFQQKLVNLDGPSARPAFDRIVEIMRKLKDRRRKAK